MSAGATRRISILHDVSFAKISADTSPKKLNTPMHSRDDTVLLQKIYITVAHQPPSILGAMRRRPAHDVKMS